MCTGAAALHFRPHLASGSPDTTRLFVPHTPIIMASAWTEVSTGEGQIYYHNTITNETSWDRPSCMAAAAPPPLPPLANGWVEVSDASGHTYFHHPATNATQWERPVASKQRKTSDVGREMLRKALSIGGGDDPLMKQDEDGNTPLYNGLANGDKVATIDELINKCEGALRVSGDNGSLPLHLICCDIQYAYAMPCSPNLLKKMLELYPAGAAVADECGALPLHLAAANEDDQGFVWAGVVKKLLEAHPAGARARDEDGSLPVHHAAMALNTEAVEHLVKAHPSSVNEKNNDGDTPLRCAEKGAGYNDTKPSPALVALLGAKEKTKTLSVEQKREFARGMRLLKGKKDIPGAIAVLKKYAHDESLCDRIRGEATAFIAMAYLQNKQKDKAKESARDALALYPSCARAAKMLEKIDPRAASKSKPKPTAAKSKSKTKVDDRLSGADLRARTDMRERLLTNKQREHAIVAGASCTWRELFDAAWDFARAHERRGHGGKPRSAGIHLEFDGVVDLEEEVEKTAALTPMKWLEREWRRQCSGDGLDYGLNGRRGPGDDWGAAHALAREAKSQVSCPS